MNHSRQISAVATAALMALLMLVLSFSRLSWNPEEPWPPVSEPYIEVAQAEEFIEPEPVPMPKNAPADLDAPALTETKSDVPAKAAPESGALLKDKGAVDKQVTPPREVTTKKPAHVKQQPTPKPEKKATPNENAKKDAREAEAKRTSNTVKNAFAKPDAKNNANNRSGDTGKAGSPKGKADSAGPANSKSTTSGVRHGRLGGGWQWPAYAVNIATAKTGSVILTLTIDKNGNVTKAVPSGGEAPASSDASIINKCINIARSRRFTRSESAGEAPETAVATLTFTFK